MTNQEVLESLHLLATDNAIKEVKMENKTKVIILLTTIIILLVVGWTFNRWVVQHDRELVEKAFIDTRDLIYADLVQRGTSIMPITNTTSLVIQAQVVDNNLLQTS